MYFKKNWGSMAEKGPLFGRIDIFQTSPKQHVCTTKPCRLQMAESDSSPNKPSASGKTKVLPEVFLSHRAFPAYLEKSGGLVESFFWL